MIKRIYLEITDSCNLNCPFCRNAKGQSFMSFAQICHCIDEIATVSDYIYLHVLGEPLLHPDFDKILDYLDIKGLKLQLVSNGTLLKNHPNIISHSCLRKLSISLHSVNNLNISDDYFKVIDQLIENHGNAALELRFYDPKSLDIKLNNYLTGLKQRYEFKTTRRNNSITIGDKVFIYFENFFKWPDMADDVISERGYCHGGKDMLAVLHNGEVTLCCLDPKGHNSLGNIKEKSLKEILLSDSYLNYLQALNDGKIISDFCKRCSYRLRFDDNSN